MANLNTETIKLIKEVLIKQKQPETFTKIDDINVLTNSEPGSILKINRTHKKQLN